MTVADDSSTPPEQPARQRINEMLGAVGWVVQDDKSVNLSAGLGVTVGESPRRCW